MSRQAERKWARGYTKLAPLVARKFLFGPHVDRSYQSILGLLKPCLETAAAGRSRVGERREKGDFFSPSVCTPAVCGWQARRQPACRRRVITRPRPSSFIRVTGFVFKAARLFFLLVSLVLIRFSSVMSPLRNFYVFLSLSARSIHFFPSSHSWKRRKKHIVSGSEIPRTSSLSGFSDARNVAALDARPRCCLSWSVGWRTRDAVLWDQAAGACRSLIPFSRKSFMFLVMKQFTPAN